MSAGFFLVLFLGLLKSAKAFKGLQGSTEVC